MFDLPVESISRLELAYNSGVVLAIPVALILFVFFMKEINRNDYNSYTNENPIEVDMAYALFSTLGVALGIFVVASFVFWLSILLGFYWYLVLMLTMIPVGALFIKFLTLKGK